MADRMFQVGDRVRVVVEAEITELWNNRLVLDGHDIATDRASATVELLPPAHWPPRHRDVWIDRDGDPWTGTDNGHMASDHGLNTCRYILDNYGPLTLVWREGKPVPEPASVDPEKLARLLCRTSYEVRGSAEAAETWDVVSDAIRAEYRHEADALLRLCIVTPREQQDGGGQS
jgi:hypothetical protein